MFGAYGNSDVYLTNLSNISSIDDTLEVEEVIIIKKSKNRDKGNSFWKGTEHVVLFCNVGNEDITVQEKSSQREIVKKILKTALIFKMDTGMMISHCEHHL